MNEQDLFLQVLKQPNATARQQLLDRVCFGQSPLRERMEVLLKAHEGAGDFLESPAANPLLATLDRPPMAEPPGAIIGRYKLLEQIGEGGMGLVYMAEQQEPVRRLVALKVIKPGMDSKQVIARFEAERQALAMMDHPNIAKVLDAGTVGENKDEGGRMKGENRIPGSSFSLHPSSFASARPYFVMELVRGIPFNEFCDQKQLPVSQRLSLFSDVCQAVQHAHQKGIIHRDLKPSNVLVTMADAQPVPKVIDFGVAKALGQSLTDHTLHTGYSQMVGTPLYMSPEQAEMNLFGVDTRSDVYSLGVMLYELLTGTTPFDKDRLKSVGFEEIRRIIREEEPETVSNRLARTRSRHTPCAVAPDSQSNAPSIQHSSFRIQNLHELDWIVARALEKDRTRRYESPSALAADIHRYLSDEPVLACPPTTMYRFQKFARKHKAPLTTAAAIATCLLLGTTVSAWQAVRATTAEIQAKANASDAQEKANEATEQRDEAQKQRDEVKALADKLAVKDQQLQRTLYAAHMNLAHNAWNAGNIRRVSGLLEQHFPKLDEPDLRAFEWHYLHRLLHPEILTIKRNGGAIAFSPDGKLLACSDKKWDELKKAFGEPEVKICNALTGVEIIRFKAYPGSLAFSPDGKRLATAGSNQLKVWDTLTGKEVFHLTGHSGGLECVTYSPSGKHLASGSNVWTQQQDTWLKVPAELKIWDASTGQQLISKNSSDTVSCVAFSPSGDRLASSSYDTIRISNVASGEELVAFKAHEEEVHAISFFPDGKRLASGGFQGAKVWDAQTGQKILDVKGAAGQVNSVAISPDGKRLAAVGLRRPVRVWDLATGEEIFSFKGHTGWVDNLAFHPDGTKLASTGNGDGTVRIWDVSMNHKDTRFTSSNVRRKSVGFTADGRRITGCQIEENADEKGAPATTTKIWDTTNGQELISIKHAAGGSRIVVISPDGKWLAAGCGMYDESKRQWVSGEAIVWNAHTGQEHARLGGFTWPVVDLAFSPDSSRLVGCGSNPSGDGNDQGKPCEVKIWDIISGTQRLAIKGHKSLVNCVTYSPNGKRLATLSRDKTVKIWNAQTGDELMSLPVQIAMGGALAFSPDGRRLAASNKPANTLGPADGGEIKLWDAESGRELLTLQGHAANVTSLAFSPDGKRLASATGSGPGPHSAHEVKVWDLATGEELLTFPNIGSGGVAFSPDGHQLATGGIEGLKIYNATPLLTP